MQAVTLLSRNEIIFGIFHLRNINQLNPRASRVRRSPLINFNWLNEIGHMSGEEKPQCSSRVNKMFQFVSDWGTQRQVSVDICSVGGSSPTVFGVDQRIHS